jgi:hypothetical protein
MGDHDGRRIDADRIYSPSELAPILRREEITIIRWLRSGKLPGRVVAREWQTLGADLIDYLRQPDPAVIARQAVRRNRAARGRRTRRRPPGVRDTEIEPPEMRSA